MISGRPPWALASTAQPAAAASIAESGQRVGRGRGHGDHVGGAEHVLEVVAEAEEAQPVADPESLGQRTAPATSRSSAPGHGVAGEQADHAARRAARGSASARTSTSWPFQSEIRPSTAITGASVRQPERRRARPRGARRGLDSEPVGDHLDRARRRRTAPRSPARRTAARRRCPARGGRAGHAPPEAGVDLAHVPDVGGTGARAAADRAAEHHRGVGVHERDARGGGSARASATLRRGPRAPLRPATPPGSSASARRSTLSGRIDHLDPGRLEIRGQSSPCSGSTTSAR